MVQVRDIKIGGSKPVLISGPCVIESEDLCCKIAEAAATVAEKVGWNYIFKASFDKANRSSLSSFRGPGLENGLKILAGIRQRFDVPVLSDVHESSHAAPAAAVLDLLQIPAFLCRQTDLLVACAKTGKPVNLKKGQFMAPWEMAPAVEKLRQAGAPGVALTDRGTFFGYNRLVSDLRGVPQMQALGCPVIFDATHSIMEPGGLGVASGGQREFAPILARAAMAAGADGLFIECHPDPDQGKSDSASMIPLDWLEPLLQQCLRIAHVVQEGKAPWKSLANDAKKP